MMAILVVEDEPLLNLDISDALSAKGYEVIAVTNADHAIKALEFRHDIHTIFTDINLPGSMDGLRLAAAVRDRWPPVNIIVTTGMRCRRTASSLPSHIVMTRSWRLCTCSIEPSCPERHARTTCPLWVKSRLMRRKNACPLYTQWLKTV